MRVLFVCTGNICRSPTAERLLTAAVERYQVPHVIAESAGTRAVVGQDMEATAARVLRRLGGDPTNFVARQLTPRLAREADLILTMSKAQRDYVLELVPTMLRFTFTLSECAAAVRVCGANSISELSAARPHLTRENVPDIMDPIGHNEKIFEEVGSSIAGLVEAVPSLCR